MIEYKKNSTVYTDPEGNTLVIDNATPKGQNMFIELLSEHSDIVMTQATNLIAKSMVRTKRPIVKHSFSERLYYLIHNRFKQTGLKLYRG